MVKSFLSNSNLFAEEFVMDRLQIRENVLIHLDSLQKRELSAMTRPVSTLAIREVRIMF